MRTAALAFVTTLGLLAAAPTARPCGVFVPDSETANVAIDAQRALLVLHERTVDMHLQLTADTDGSDFAWLLPVPDEPGLALGDQAVFDALDDLTTPRVTAPAKDSGGGGGFCGSTALDGGAANGTTGGVQHFGSGELGGYTWDLIGGTDAAAVTAWLTDHGYAVPSGFETVVSAYTGARWLAVKLSPSALAVALPLEPLVVTVPRPGDSRLLFPLGVSKPSAKAVTPLVIYTLADQRYRVANAASAELDDVGDELRARLDDGESFEYEAAVDAMTERGGGLLVVTEHAGHHDPASVPAALAAVMGSDAQYLTRLFARVPAASLQDLVITFAFEGGDVESTLIVDNGGPSGAMNLAWALVGLLVGVLWVRPRACASA
ncbi:MAG: DUF2330 domain-containing protein [Myxococcales bacterium]|nr:DUF2330 domain-containing protein [Myxococcales bacterium]MCB9734337.1 DUF2330 domain-containing protein [Deltaproteobacteria bacterium]